MAKLFYTLEEAAQKLRKSTDEVMSMARAGQLVELRDKDQVLFRRSAIDQLVGDGDMGSDTNLDGQVDVGDALNMLSGGKFNTGLPADWTDGDSNQDGVFDLADQLDFLNANVYDAGSYLPVAQSAAAAEAGTSTTLSPADAAFAAIASESQGVVGTGRKKSVFSVI